MSIFKMTATGDGPKAKSKRISEGTEQQEQFWQELINGASHVMVEARAGCGKSSAVREGMHRLLAADPAVRMTYAVYNKINADEFRDDCPQGVETGTMHSLGLKLLRQSYGSQVEKLKTYSLLDTYQEGKNLPRYVRKSIAFLTSKAKDEMLIPDAPELAKSLHQLIDKYGINPFGRAGVIVDHAIDILRRAAEWVEVIDYEDMLWLPVLHQIKTPDVDLFFLDEAADLNPAQHAMIPLLCRSGRVVAVGDRFQAMYAFRGADADSMPRLEERLAASKRGLKTLPLTITFRCPHSHVLLANEFVPDLQAHASNPDGVVLRGYEIEQMLEEVRPGDFVICPQNAPLISAALKQIARGQPALVRGRAIGEQLASIVRSVKEPRTIADLSYGVEQWKSRELVRLSQLEGAEDKVEETLDRAAGLQAIMSFCVSPGEVDRAIYELFSEEVKTSAAIFSTVHRAKGLESASVWFIDNPMRPAKLSWEIQQQKNLRYVALTRSKNRLVFVRPVERK